MNARIEQPNEAELEWIDANLRAARSLVAATTGADTDSPSLEQLDLAFERWLHDWLEQPEWERDDPNQYINALGIAFGQHLVDDMGLEWKLVTDDDGTEIAVHGQPGDVLVFPPNLVAKRFVAGETGFLQPIYDEIAASVERIR